MPHEIDGFEVVFTGRKSWKARISKHKKEIAVAPVSWTKGHHRDSVSGVIHQEVHFTKPKEAESVNASREPFLVALGRAHDYSEFPHRFKEFVGVYRVVPTGRMIDVKTIECKVLDRVRAADV